MRSLNVVIWHFAADGRIAYCEEESGVDIDGEKH